MARRKMRYLPLLILLLPFLSQQIDAQELYFRLSGGYTWAAGKTEFNDADPNEITRIRQSTDVTLNAEGTVTIKVLISYLLR